MDKTCSRKTRSTVQRAVDMIKLKNILSEGQIFHLMSFQFDIDKAIKIIKEKKIKPKMVDITKYAEQILSLDRKQPEARTQSFFAHIDYEYLRKIPADRLNEAGIMATIRTHDKKVYTVVIDGNHRLAKNYLDGKDKMPMYYLDEKTTENVLV